MSGISNQPDSSSSVVSNVVNISGAISYVPLAAVPTSEVQTIAIDGISPGADSVDNGTYSFWSIEHLYSKQVATGLALSFISFFSTATGAADLTSYGAVPIKNIAQAARSSHTPGPTV